MRLRKRTMGMRIVRDLHGNLVPFDEPYEIKVQAAEAADLGMFFDELTGLILTTDTLDDATRPYYLDGLWRLRMMLRVRTNAMTSERVGRIN